MPIIETQEQDISAYIPTNLISITDGQIYLSPTLFELGVLPAIDVSKSVSRVGAKAQKKVYQSVAGELKLAYAQFVELENFARFGARLDDDTQKIIKHGLRIRACLIQSEFTHVSMLAQVAILLALKNNLFDAISLVQMAKAQMLVANAVVDLPHEVAARLSSIESIKDTDLALIVSLAKEALSDFSANKSSHEDE